MQVFKLVLILGISVSSLAQNRTCFEKKVIYPTLNITNETESKTRIKGEIWAYGEGITLTCQGPGDTFAWLRWSHGKWQDVESDDWATRLGNGRSIKLKRHPGPIIDWWKDGNIKTLDSNKHSGFVRCLAWENTIAGQRLSISKAVPIRYPFCVNNDNTGIHEWYYYVGTCCHYCFAFDCVPDVLLENEDPFWTLTFADDVLQRQNKFHNGLYYCHIDDSFGIDSWGWLFCYLRNGNSKLYTSPERSEGREGSYEHHFLKEAEYNHTDCKNDTHRSDIPPMIAPVMTYHECSITLETEELTEELVLNGSDFHMSKHGGHWFYTKLGQSVHQLGYSLTIDKKSNFKETQILYCLDMGENETSCIRVTVNLTVQSSAIRTATIIVSIVVLTALVAGAAIFIALKYISERAKVGAVQGQTSTLPAAETKGIKRQRMKRRRKISEAPVMTYQECSITQEPEKHVLNEEDSENSDDGWRRFKTREKRYSRWSGDNTPLWNKGSNAFAEQSSRMQKKRSNTP